jgi:hypothetical protein
MGFVESQFFCGLFYHAVSQTKGVEWWDDWRLTNELKMIWKEEVVAWSRYYLGTCPEGLGKTTKSSVRRACVRQKLELSTAKIQLQRVTATPPVRLETPIVDYTSLSGRNWLWRCENKYFGEEIILHKIFFLASLPLKYLIPLPLGGHHRPLAEPALSQFPHICTLVSALLNLLLWRWRQQRSSKRP